MKQITCVLICLLFFSSISLSQIESSIPQTHLSMPVLIEIPGGSGKAYGSGFFIGDSGKTCYLITAKHVLFDPNRLVLLGDSATVFIPASDVTDTSTSIMRLNLRQLLIQRAILTNSISDIALIRIHKAGLPNVETNVINFPKIAKSGWAIRPFVMLTQYADVVLGNDVFVYGYPISLGMRSMPQFDPYKPLLRKGIVAGKYDPRQTIIIDCPAYAGNSGGPVIQVSPIGLGEMKFKIIGVVTEFIPFDVSKVVPFLRPGYFATNSGYAVVESTDRIFEILAEEP